MARLKSAKVPTSDGVVLYSDTFARVTTFNPRPMPTRVAVADTVYRALVDTPKRAAKLRGLTWNLSLEEFKCLAQADCFYCGAAPANQFRKWYHRNTIFYEATWQGVDRVDSTRGYEPDNVVPCCKWCNWAKADRTTEEFLQWVQRLAVGQSLIFFRERPAMDKSKS